MKVRDCVFPDCDCPNHSEGSECLFTPTTYDRYVQRMNEQNRKDELFSARVTWFVFGVVLGVTICLTVYFFTV
jgi:hypothetical protein